jgi:hypothetical protein
MLSFVSSKSFMKIRNFFYLLFTLFTFSFTRLASQTVYIAETGKKYHTKNCYAVKNSKKTLELSEAKKKGYKPCKTCGADKIIPKDEKKNSKKD